MLWFVLTGCALFGPKDETEPLRPILPVAAWWEADAPVVAVGDEVGFTLHLVWPDALDGLEITHTQEEGHGFSFDWSDPTAVRATKVTPTSGPDAGRDVSIGGTLGVCGDDECEYLGVAEVVVRVAGGETHAVVFPVDATALGVGESRPISATPIGWRPALGGPSADFNDTVHTQDPVTYTSEAPAVFAVDADGVITGLAAGAGDLVAEAGGAVARLPVTVTDEVPGPVREGAYALTTRFWGGPLLSDTGRDDRTPETLAFGPDGALWALSPAHVWLDGATHVTQRNPLHLVGWTGTGFGYEAISDWTESPSDAFLEVALDGHLYAGWLSEEAHGFTLLSRPADAAAGGWTRRFLSASPDPAHPRPADNQGWDPVHDVQVATLPHDDGVWVAWTWAEPVPDPLPGWPSQCVATLRLATVTPEAVAYQDLLRVFLDPGPGVNGADALSACHEFLEWSDPIWPEIRLGAPPPGTAEPLVWLGDDEAPVVLGKGLGGWTSWEPESLRAFDGDIALFWSPGFPLGDAAWTDPPPMGAVLASEPGGSIWVVDADAVGTRWTSDGVLTMTDSLLGPHFPDADLHPGSGTYEAFASGWGQFAVISTLTPPGRPERPDPTWPYTTWLYVTDLDVPAATSRDDLDDGRALGAATWGEAAALDDGRIVLWHGDGVHEVLPGGNFNALRLVDPDADGSTALPTAIGDTVVWTSGDRVLRVAGGSVQASGDGATFATLGTLPEGTPMPVAAGTAPDGSHWVCAGTISPRIGPQVLRIVETVDGLEVEEVDLPAFTDEPAGVTPETCAVWPDEGGLWVVRAGYWEEWRVSVTRVTSEGTTTVSSDFPAQPELHRGGPAGGSLIVPWWTNTERGALRSGDGGATWTASPLPAEANTAGRGVGLVPLADGRAAWLGARRLGLNRQEAAMWLTDDGAEWGEPVAIRPWGGAWQEVVSGVGLPDGALFVHLVDDQSLWGGFSRFDATDLPGIAQRVTP